MPKNIVVFSDGTGQKGGKDEPTNVYKLFNLILDRSPEQIAFYDPGLGTDYKKATGNISGRGFSRNILQCYEFIFNHFEAGDKIFLFGFSRGAATVRSLSSFIHYFGILPKSRSDLISKAYKIYRKSNPGKRKNNAEKFIDKHHTMWTKVEFLGVWDTVAALGFPVEWISKAIDPFFPHRFHDFKLSESVVCARHALAIDDERKAFHPLYWLRLDHEDKPISRERMKQVWFCGAHTDVGGGFKDRNLSDITLIWMMNEAIARGLILFPRSDKYKELLKRKIDINGEIHDEFEKARKYIFPKKRRTWNRSEHGEPCVHESVFQRTLNAKNEPSPGYDPWIVKEMSKNKNERLVEPWITNLITI